MTVGHNSKAELKRFAERLVSMDQQIKEATETHVAPLKSDRADILKEAAATGFDKKALKELVRKMKMDEQLRSTVDLYEHAVLDILE